MDLTDEQWLARLDRKLTEQQEEIKVWIAYYEGEHDINFATKRFEQAFGEMFGGWADNWCRTIVDAPVERLKINGFNIANKRDKEAAWKVFKANKLQAESPIAHTESVKTGRSYLISDPGAKRITIEDPLQVYVEHAPGDRRERLAAIKKWRGEDGYIYANVYLPGRVVKFRSGVGLGTDSANGSSVLASGLILPTTLGTTGGWELKPGDPGGTVDADVVTVIPLYNNPDIRSDGQSDLLPAKPLQDAINKELMDMLVASEFAAFRQRIFSGVQVPTIKDPKNPDGKEIPDPSFAIKMAMDRVVAVEASAKANKEGGGVGVHEFAASDLGNYVKAVNTLLQHLAAQTRTPPHYLLGQIVNASGDALKAAETGLVAKVKAKQEAFSDSWSEAIGIAIGRDPDSIETSWTDPEYRSEGETVDAAIKMRALGVPLKALWKKVGASPEEIEEWGDEIDAHERIASIAAAGAAQAKPSESAPPTLAEPAVTIQERIDSNA